MDVGDNVASLVTAATHGDALSAASSPAGTTAAPPSRMASGRVMRPPSAVSVWSSDGAHAAFWPRRMTDVIGPDAAAALAGPAVSGIASVPATTASTARPPRRVNFGRRFLVCTSVPASSFAFLHCLVPNDFLRVPSQSQTEPVLIYRG